MAHYIDADCLKAEIERRRLSNRYIDTEGYESELIDIIDSLQQDEKAVELEMCSQSYWEERGWMMIPPDVTLKGIESLLEQVRKKLQQEQPQVADASKMAFPKVDLQKEVNDYICSDEYLNTRGDGSLLIARHFYELGLNARKEK